MAFKLINAEDIKSLSKGELGTSFDALLNNILIPAVGETFAFYCQRPDFDKRERTEYHSPGENQRHIFLQSPPVAASPIVQLWQSGAAPRVYSTDELLVNGTDYFVLEDQGVLEKPCSFICGPKTVKAIYTGGYLTGDAQAVPADLRLAAIMQVKGLFDRREELFVSGRSLEGGSLSMLAPLTLPTSITMILDRYKIRTV